MEVTAENFYDILKILRKEGLLAIDTETTGLKPFQGDILFSIIIASRDEVYYFNFNEYANKEALDESFLLLLKPLFADPLKTWIAHNATFDMHILAKEGLYFAGDVVDLEMLSRVEYNFHLKHSLDAIAKRFGYEKMEIKPRTQKVTHPVLNKTTRLKHFNEVPFEEIYRYGSRDARITMDCYFMLAQKILLADQQTPENLPKLHQVVANEVQLTKTIFNMEQTGVHVDINYCWAARKYNLDKMELAQKKFEELTGKPFKKSPKLFAELFGDLATIKTDKGNLKFDKDVMNDLDHPAAKIVVEISKYKKNVEYFENFIYYADDNDTIHTEFNQARTKTGRFSSSAPNLQNLTKPDKYEATDEVDEFPVRRAIVPRPGYFFAMIDYKQKEFRLFLDLAGEAGLANKIKGGMDVHQATGENAGVKRAAAKAANFSIVYSSGDEKLAKTLGIPKASAKRIKASIFQSAPKIEPLINKVMRTAELRGYIFNWFGRRSYFPNRRMAYKAPNALIQGGCADILKIAMNRCDEFLKNYRSRMVMTIHDELVFEIAYGEEDIIPQLKEIMENVYNYRLLKLEVDVEYSNKSLADKSHEIPLEFPHGKESRDEIQRKSKTDAGVIAEFMGSKDPATLH